jgi:hypothetical protein
MTRTLPTSIDSSSPTGAPSVTLSGAIPMVRPSDALA